jgi:hypothetical protein
MLITAWNAAELRLRIREEMRRSEKTAWEA